MSHGSSLDKIYTRKYIVLVGKAGDADNSLCHRELVTDDKHRTASSQLCLLKTDFFQNSFTFIETLGRYFTGVLLVPICHVVNIQALC